MSRTKKGSKGPGWEPWSNIKERQEQKADYIEPEQCRCDPQYGCSCNKPLSKPSKDKTVSISLEEKCKYYEFALQHIRDTYTEGKDKTLLAQHLKETAAKALEAFKT